MSTVIAKNIQIGTSGTPAQNFTWYQPASPDGTVRLGVGNTGATTLDAITATSAGNVTVSGSLTGGALSGSSLAVSGATTTGSLTVNNNAISAVNSLGFRNRLINSDMRIDQRNAGASVTVSGSAVTYTLDRWYGYATQASKFSVQRSTTAPTGFTNSALITSLSAYSVVSGDVFGFVQPIEGFNFADLGWGTASAQTVTLSFVVRSSLTGTFGGSIRNGSSNRSYPFTYTINAANTFETKTVTIAGDTTGTWATDNSAAAYVTFGLGVGSTYSGTAGAWAGSQLWSATGATSVVGTNGATFYITGVQLEAGTVASPFERRDYGRELIMCQRYFARVFDPPMRGVGTGGTTGGASRLALFFPQTMRAQPTVSINGTFNFWNGSATATGTTLSAYFIGGYNGIDLDITTSASFTIGQAVCAYCTNNTTTKYVDLAAEL